MDQPDRASGGASRPVYRFVVDGRVQGVYFRQSSVHRARELGLDGWVFNRPDGRVEGRACGDSGALEAFREWLRRGPPAARVDALEWAPVGDELPVGEGFEVRR